MYSLTCSFSEVLLLDFDATHPLLTLDTHLRTLTAP